MYTNNTASSTVAPLKVSRRKHLCQIFRHDHLTNDEKLLGAAIWRRVNHKAGHTHANLSTLARDIGLKRAAAHRHLNHLVTLGLFQIETRGDRRLIRPVPIFGGHTPAMAYGGREFERAMGLWFDAVIVDLTLTVAQRIAAYGVLDWTDTALGTCDAGPIDIAVHVGLHHNTARSALDALIGRHWLQVKERHRYGRVLATDLGPHNQANNQTTNQANSADKKSPVISTANSDNGGLNLSNLLNLPSLTDSDPVAQQRGNRLDLDRFTALYDLMTGVYARNDERQTVGGIVRLSSGEFDYISGDTFTGNEVQSFVHAGLLARSGKWVEITGAGVHAVETHNAIPKAA